jgi:aquaporin Z
MSDEATPTLAQRLAAEGLGTFVLVFFGCGTALASGGDYVATALAFGLTVLTMAYAVGHISGGHFNPAVSLGSAVSGRMSWADAGIYSGVQVGSGVIAGLVLFVVTRLYDLGAQLTVLHPVALVSNQYDKGTTLDWLGALLLELIGTAVFVFIILAVTDKRREGTGIPAPIAIGLALTLVHFALIGFTGTSVNPARSIGPALFAGWDVLRQQWLFILAPLSGAAVAGAGYPLIFGYDRARPVRAAKPVAAPALQWDPQLHQWVGGTPGQAWQYPQQAQQAQQSWGQEDLSAQQQWAGGTPDQTWQQPPARAPQQQWPQPDPNAPQQGWPQPDPNAPQQQWESEAEDGRTQIRPPEPPA